MWHTVAHYFLHMSRWIDELMDIRDEQLIIYKARTLIMTALVCLMSKKGARRKISSEMREAQIVRNMQELSGQDELESIPHDTTVEYLLRRSNPEEYEELLSKMLRALLRKKVLGKYRLLDTYYVVAIDGVHVHTYHYQHCTKCLRCEDAKGNGIWQHYVLQASLVTANGMSMPIAYEWIENETHYDKQDCETNAFYRLIKKIRSLYPKLPLCVVLDALYCREPVFQALEKARMEWIVVFKKGAMPEVYDWCAQYRARHQSHNAHVERKTETIAVRKKRSHQERLMRKKSQNAMREVSTIGEYAWAVNITHWNNERTYNVFSCKETRDGKVLCNYQWLCSKKIAGKINKQTITEIAHNGGRCRWNIENQGNNMLKHGGYNLEHPYSQDEVAGKCWYALIMIAHVINQLIEKGSLIAKASFGSIRAIATRMYEHLRYCRFERPSTIPKMQIRLDSS